MAPYTLGLVAVVALVTALIRFAPFLLFPSGDETPAYIRYLSAVLPYAAIGMLVVYCLKDLRPLVLPYALPELVCVTLVVVSYLWKRSTLLSVVLGTLVYMVIVQKMI
jgi:branched-subunit amino acid transport protein AzlD